MFRTPVYRAGTLSGDTLEGNLVLVGSGDLSFGLREQPDGSLYSGEPARPRPQLRDGRLPGAVEPPGDPLAALDELARTVKAAGITRVNGDVAVDDRLFTPHTYPDGLISPIWVNENLIDIEVTPGAGAGQATTIDWRPKTASYTVETQATTIDAKQTTSLEVTEPTPGHLVVTGTIAAGNTPTLVVKEITDPAAFARTAFIEALQRAGVTVTATPTGPNPVALLPAKDSYPAADKLGEHVSATLAAYVKLIMKVSYNRGADLMTCLAAVKTGSTDCEEGLAAEVDTATALGVSKDQRVPLRRRRLRRPEPGPRAALATFYGRPPRRRTRRCWTTRCPSSARTGRWPTSCRTHRRPATRRSRRATGSWAQRPTSSSCWATASPATSRPRAAGRSRSWSASATCRSPRSLSSRQVTQTRRRWPSPSSKPSDAPTCCHAMAAHRPAAWSTNSPPSW